MAIFEGRQFTDYDDRPTYPWQRGRRFSDLIFNQCQFESCTISVTADANRRSFARNIQLTNCVAHSVAVCSLVAEEVLVDGLKTVDLLQTWGAVFKHVTLRGKIGRIMISDYIGMGNEKQQRALREANASYYSGVDWALDISEAEFQEVDLRGVPGHLIRRDPATQILVTRESAQAGKWRDLDLSQISWTVSLGLLAKGHLPSQVLVAEKRARNFPRLMEGLKLLRDAGVAEPD